ncbi:MAG: 30S ribosomal protein S12 methylthiotransferase RimO [Pelosinus sp.]|nr:30S ribosomal protein S12 methylthiotransferase RimO [Pelosinus sp.]
MLKAGFISLGCAKNLVDTEVMLGLIAENKIEITPEPEKADIIIVNTCGFIDAAKEESINTILQMSQYKKNGSCRGIIVAGCLGQRYRQQLLDELPEVDAIVGTGAWHRINEAIEAVLQGQRVLMIDDNNTIYDENMPRITTTPFYSAYIKVAEGCSNCCTFCAIPLIRGGFRSRPIESIVQEARQLACKGIKEINLIAQDTTSYGKDLYDSPHLVELLKELVTIKEITWIRLLYCYPKYFSDELIDLIAKEPKICKYVDLPLQHIDDEILQAMNRRDSRTDIETLLAKLRDRIPGLTLRSSFIVGFPGENDQHFAALRDFVETQRFDRVGVFTYSQEEGTKAALLSPQIPDEIKEERYHTLMSLQSKISEELNLGLEGQRIEVLVENISEEPGVVTGRSYREAPDIDGQIYVEKAADSKPGEMIKAKIVQGFTYDLLAEKLTE